ncbi:MAG: hypothetical protein A3G87_05875 [Omnitrophica bacterium RIFCSPLOWO2_12_FULL_50_11]|nr:MAG: hypothetical protein A3G87_05875 [Omnitrophica bacterium RIFCSPLOWO2_12_FULL_50_11]
MESSTTLNSKVTVPPLQVVFEKEARERILAALDDCLASGLVASGKNVQAFENWWANDCRTKHGIACSSGGAALEIIMKALDVRGKDVLVPTNTFIATVNAVIFAGGNPIFLDVDPKTMGVNLEEMKRKTTNNTVAAVVVHIGGIMTPEMPMIADWCQEQHILLIEDAAHAPGSEVGGKRAGQYGIAAAYSFFATKVVTCGEGGMVVTNDDRLADRCRCIQDYGKKSQWESEHTILSSNYRMSEIDAIIGLAHAQRLEEFIAYRKTIADRYTEALRGVLELVLPAERSSWYKYIAFLPEEMDRARFRGTLKEIGITLPGGVYDLPIHLQPVFESYQLRGTLPVSEDVCSRHICLPIFSSMTNAQVEYTISSVRSLVQPF